jgi:hypothetical protein
MLNTRSPLLSVALVVVAVACVVLAVLYLTDVVTWLTTDPNKKGPHTTHAILLGVVAIAALIAANFARPKSA